MTETFADRAEQIEKEAVEYAASFLAKRKLGSWVSREVFEQAMAGWRVDLHKVNERLGKEYDRAVWIVMDRNSGRLGGLIIGDETVVKGLAQIRTR